MTRIAAALVVTLLVLAGCAASDNGGTIGGGPITKVAPAPAGSLHSQLPPDVAARGTLRVGAFVGRAPLLFYATGTTTAEGIDQDILQAMGRLLGVTISLGNLPLQKLGPEVLAGHLDAFDSGFVDLKAFQGAGIDFVDDMIGRSSVLVREANPAKVIGPDDLCGRKVSLLAGTAQQVTGVNLDTRCKSRHKPEITFRGEADHTTALADVVNGSVDALLDDAVVAAYTAEVSSGAASVKVVGAAVDPLPYGIGVAKTNPQLRDALVAALQGIIRDGEYDAALAKWGGSTAALRTASVDAGT